MKRLVDALRREKLGLIVDIVPNHMAATLENPWWVDVLRNGQASRYARYFDIDWERRPRLRQGLPALAGQSRCSRGTAGRDRHLGLPKPGAYRLGWWRIAGDRINWRRFFDINELVCLRMEDEEAFEAAHAMIARLYAEGMIDGVRVDHIDGLADPAGYCRKLRQRLDPKNPARPYLVVEKILLRGETLPADWGCDGTTGYDFMDEVSALQHDPAAEPALAKAWAALTRTAGRFCRRGGRRAPRDHRPQLFRAARSLRRRVRSGRRRRQRRLSRPALRRALTEMLVHFPVYRGYGTAATSRI